MKELAYEKLWFKPRFKETKDMDFLKDISHLPIRELNVLDFSCSWVELVGVIRNLKLLHIDGTLSKRSKPFNKQLRHLMIPVVVYTGAFIFEEDNFDHFLSILKTILVKEIIIDYYIDDYIKRQ